MAAHAVVVLDVTAPVVTLGYATETDSEIRVAYSVTEPGVVSAEVVGIGPATVHPAYIAADTGNRYGTLRILARDDVGNERLQDLEYEVSAGVANPGWVPFGHIGRVAVGAIGRVAGAVGRIGRGRGGRIR